MVPVAVLIVIALIIILFWAVRTGQFDDLERQGFNILLDDDKKTKKAKTSDPKDKLE